MLRGTAFLPLALMASQAIWGASAVTINYPDASCDPTKKAVIEKEMGFTRDMAKAAQDNLQKGGYFDIFFANGLRADPGFSSATEEMYGRIAAMADGTSGYDLQVTCIEDQKNCVKRKWTAYMNDGKKTMNFCSTFFAPGKAYPTGEIPYQSTQDLLNNCNMNLREAQWGKASILLHELTHTGYATGSSEGTKDYAYGFGDNYKLPLRLLDRDCPRYASQKKSVLCPDASGKEGICEAERSGDNADTYAFVAAGVYFSTQCNRDIPLPPLPAGVPAPPVVSLSSSVQQTPAPSASVPPTASLSVSVPPTVSLSSSVMPTAAPSSSVPTPIPTPMRRFASLAVRANDTAPANPAEHRSCPLESDAIVFDGDPNEPLAISGLVTFGDSYGAGMGTGTTSGDACRVGSNNYGQLFYDWVGDSSIPFERKVCSGDTTEGLNKKIDEWSNPQVANVGTLSIGGNDLGFSDLVWYCIITPNTARLGSTNRRNCVDAENRARNLTNDRGPDGMRAKLKNSYLKILEKSGRYDFHLYVTSYADFFNDQTTDCDRSSFHYWWGQYNPPRDWILNRIVYLTRSLRSEMGGLVQDLNRAIADAVADANEAWGGQQVHFVDVNAPFGGHRWCEPGGHHEPDANLPSTWFFLSGWKDLPVEGGAAVDTAALERAEAASLFAGGSVPVPDGRTCFAALGPDADPYARAMCRVAENVMDHPDGPEARRLADANAALRRGDFQSEDVAGYLPTRQIKTFHPRSPGMAAYRDAVITEMQNVGQL